MLYPGLIIPLSTSLLLPFYESFVIFERSQIRTVAGKGILSVPDQVLKSWGRVGLARAHFL